MSKVGIIINHLKNFKNEQEKYDLFMSEFGEYNDSFEFAVINNNELTVDEIERLIKEWFDKFDKIVVWENAINPQLLIKMYDHFDVYAFGKEDDGSYLFLEL